MQLIRGTFLVQRAEFFVISIKFASAKNVIYPPTSKSVLFEIISNMGGSCVSQQDGRLTNFMFSKPLTQRLSEKYHVQYIKSSVPAATGHLWIYMHKIKF